MLFLEDAFIGWEGPHGEVVGGPMIPQGSTRDAYQTTTTQALTVMMAPAFFGGAAVEVFWTPK